MAGDYSRTLSGSFHGKGPSILQRLNVDMPLFLLLVGISILGLFVLYSASGQDWGMVQKQFLNYVVGFTAMIFIAQLHPKWLASWAPWLYGAGVIALVLVLLIGVGAKGAQRWLSLGFMRFQPAEIVKLAVPMMVAWYLSHKILPPKFKHIAMVMLIIFVPVLLVLKQPDLGTSILVAASGLIILFFAGLGWRWIFSAMLVLCAVAPLMWYGVMHDYQKQRVLTFLDPESDPLGSGWNIIQSKTAIGSGGLAGKGWTGGTQSQLEFLPERHTDFIIAVYCEEFGFVGVVLLLLLYASIIMRALYISSQSSDVFGRLLAGGLTITFFIYVFVNIGMVSGILPVVGVPLPLISYGGTSVVALLSTFGVIMSVYMHKH